MDNSGADQCLPYRQACLGAQPGWGVGIQQHDKVGGRAGALIGNVPRGAVTVPYGRRTHATARQSSAHVTTVRLRNLCFH